MVRNTRYNKPKKPKIGAGYTPPYNKELLDKPVECLNLSEDVLSVIKRGGVLTLNDIAIRYDTDMYKMQNFNKKSLFELKSKMKTFGFDFRKKEEVSPEAESDKKEIKPDNKKREKREEKIEEPIEKEIKRERPKSVPVKEIQDIYVKINKGGFWGFQERTSGKITVEPQFDELFSFKEELCCAEKGERFGFIDRKGNTVIPFDYECALSFSEGLASVGKKGLMGYIDKDNNVVVNFEFDAATSFSEGEARVKKDGKWGALKLIKDDNGQMKVEIRWIN